ncbi:cyclic GMP-AMP synthase-like isoform X1 [Stegodyphus dumicola]|uniref:cyclic GMP-AMP synthase-like isoform X1 n=1 Tax=Stegodyphus dumicola TaxID=202533 RepID=UPI0015A971AB|nr:cyclic GMP-AMP synthase-like isoform X1 [Stegodyphus dumicola]XP_035227885.1 cyclic GMP-AMP synthase-like isoform X1 [Stegodyphus dumicola]XP_035227886.1 cyclic GMP-AMP synthase-like isoform X1 [Stegodyphus dumicola]
MSFRKCLVCNYCKRKVSISDESFPENLFDLITKYKIDQLLWICKACKISCHHSCCSSKNDVNEVHQELLEIKEVLQHLTAEVRNCSSFVAQQYSYPHSAQAVGNYCTTSLPDTSPLQVDVSDVSFPALSRDKMSPSSSLSEASSQSPPLRKRSLSQSPPICKDSLFSSSPKKSKAARELMQSILKNQIKIDPNEEMNSRKVVTAFLNILTDALKGDNMFNLLYEKPYYTGSSYHGLRVASASEFDIDIVLHVPQQISLKVEFFDSTLAFAKIKWEVKSELPENKIDILKFLNSNSVDCYLEPVKITSWFQSLLDRFLSKLVFKDDIKQVKNHKSGPARTVEIETYSSTIINIDLVPVFQFDHQQLSDTPIAQIFQKYPKISCAKKICFFIPKQCAGEVPMSESDCNISWRLDFPEIERSVLHNKQCAKPIIKLIKLLRDKSDWKGLASYHIKTVMLWEVSKNTNHGAWDNTFLYERYLQVMKQLYSYLKNRNLPFFFHPQLNLLHKFNEETYENWSNRLKDIISSIESNHEALLKYYC